MIRAVFALAGLALTAAAPARASESTQPPAQPLSAAVATGSGGDAERPETVSRVASWIGVSRDNGSLPYIIIDKQTAELFLFDSRGRARGTAPVLIGVAVGDEATAGVGAKSLAEIGPAERTTPAGRFVARYGLAVGKQRVLWVDYGTSVALHPLVKGTKQERRRERLLSPTSDDNRITFGCINVPPAFYSRSVQPLFRKKGGVVYILPDTKPLDDVFPRLRLLPYLNGGGSAAAAAETAQPAAATEKPKASETPPARKRPARGSRSPRHGH